MTDSDLDALMSPQPTVVVKALRDDPMWVKCPRCWHYHTIKLNFDGLCDRCCSVLVEAWPDHPSVPLIKANLDEQRKRFTVEHKST